MQNEKARELVEFRSKLTSLITHGRLLVTVESIGEEEVSSFKEIANAVLEPAGIDVNGPENVGGDRPVDDIELTLESLLKTAKGVDAAILKAEEPSASMESAGRFADIFPAFVMPEKVESVDDKVDRAVGGFFPQWAEHFRQELQKIKDRRGDGLMPVAALESVMNETMLNTQAITRLDQDPEANAVRWIEVYKSIQGLKVVLRLLAKCPLDQLDGDEFGAIKKLIRNTIIRCGFYVDEVDYANTAVELDKVVDKALEIAHTRVQMHWKPGMPGALTE